MLICSCSSAHRMGVLGVLGGPEKDDVSQRVLEVREGEGGVVFGNNMRGRGLPVH